MSRHVVTFEQVTRRKVRREIDLLPCPFCGGAANFAYSHTDNFARVKCADCSAQTPFRGAGSVDRRELSSPEQRASELWNRRAQA